MELKIIKNFFIKLKSIKIILLGNTQCKIKSKNLLMNTSHNILLNSNNNKNLDKILIYIIFLYPLSLAIGPTVIEIFLFIFFNF